MISTITAFLGSLTWAHLIAGSTLIPVFIWGFGKLRKTEAYTKALGALGKASMGLGVTIDAFGQKTFGKLYAPLEDLVCDFLHVFVENFLAGLRKNNPEKLLKQAVRLEESGSKNRAHAIMAKIANDVGIENVEPKTASEQKVLAKAFGYATTATKNRLKDD